MADNLAPFPVDPTLTAVSIAFRNPAHTLIADQVMPKTPVATKAFKYLSFDSAQAYTIPETRVGRKSAPTTVEFAGTEVAGKIDDYGLDDIVPVDDIEQARAGRWSYDPLSKAVEFLSDLIALDREKRVATAVQNTDHYLSSQATTLSGNAQWSNTASDPLNALLTALDKPLLRPNVLVMGREVWSKLRQHAKIVKAVQQNDGDSGAVSQKAVADLLEISQVLVGDSFVNTAKRGQTASFSRVWGKNAALLYVNPMAGPSGSPSWGFTASYQGRIAGQISDQMKGARGSVVVRVVESCAEVVSAKGLGYFFKSAVA